MTFADANNASTTATFPVPGNYALQLTATNSLAETSSTLTVTVVPPPSAFDSWLTTHFGSTPDPADSDNLADPDHDGLANLIEFATGGIPTIPNKTPVSLTNQEAVLELIYPQSRAAVADGITFEVEWSDHLADGWSTAGVSQSAIPESDNDVARFWKATVPKGTNGTRFLRLRIRKP